MSRCVDCLGEMDRVDAQTYLQCHACRCASFRLRRRLLGRIHTFAEYVEQENKRRRQRRRSLRDSLAVLFPARVS